MPSGRPFSPLCAVRLISGCWVVDRDLFYKNMYVFVGPRMVPNCPPRDAIQSAVVGLLVGITSNHFMLMLTFHGCFIWVWDVGHGQGT